MTFSPLLDPSRLDERSILLGPDAIRRMLPQRGTLALIDAVVSVDQEERRIVGYKDLRGDEWWVEDHVPEHPLFPGVLMLEAGSQLAALETSHHHGVGASQARRPLIGLVGIAKAKFRNPVVPPCRLLLMARLKVRKRTLVTYEVQGLVGDRPAFEAEVTGTLL